VIADAPMPERKPLNRVGHLLWERGGETQRGDGMAEVMNRAERRAAGMHKAEPTIQVTDRVSVVPMEHVETYFNYEIAREGKWRSNVPLIIIRPDHEKGKADDGWFPKTLGRMREARRRKGAIPVRFAGMDIDVGLIDVIVSFRIMPGNKLVHPRTDEEFDMLLHENMIHIDKVCGDALHDQMVIALARHVYRSDGSFLYHYHNLVFGLRQEVRGDMDILAPLDMEPLMKALSRSGGLDVIGGVKQ
jgi:hypothetical protein